MLQHLEQGKRMKSGKCEECHIEMRMKMDGWMTGNVLDKADGTGVEVVHA